MPDSRPAASSNTSTVAAPNVTTMSPAIVHAAFRGPVLITAPTPAHARTTEINWWIRPRVVCSTGTPGGKPSPASVRTTASATRQNPHTMIRLERGTAVAHRISHRPQVARSAVPIQPCSPSDR
ncbi:hypothetical protein Aco03nite_031140 [Actinoplanes couchii]|uniref:Uncharacterized protein n=1 Tax=Actinoplanes couchii TaxID=403638 RepID=A0ABQ3X879_9ACTN|nr:hypothetical protein Aco03nite_031140 [Actinoplanes couchii]